MDVNARARGLFLNIYKSMNYIFLKFFFKKNPVQWIKNELKVNF